MPAFLHAALGVVADMWRVLSEMSPYLLLGFFIAGVLHVVMPAAFVRRHLGGRGWGKVAKAALLGVPLPLCSCSVIPVTASLRRQGAGRGAVTAFLMSTPQTGVDSILVTYSLLGPVLAIYRPIVAFLSGIVGGMAVEAFERTPQASPTAELAQPIDVSASACACTPDLEADACVADGCGCGEDEADSDRISADGSDTAPGRQAPAVWRMLRYGFITLPQDIGRPLLIGMLIAGLITALIPEHFFAPFLGRGFLAMLVMMAIGVPMYVCATASVPIAAAMITAGVSPGAALAFLVTGPVTNAAEIATLWHVMGRRWVAVYLASVVVCALGAGLLLDALLAATGWRVQPLAVSPGVEKMNLAAAVVLLIVLAYALWPLRRRGGTEEEREMENEATERIELTVTGMTCGGCVMAVKSTLQRQAGVEHVEVDLAGKHATVSGSGLNAAALVAAVEQAGYHAAPA